MKNEVNIVDEKDIIIARQKARDAAKKLGFSIVDQTRIITAVSELARNIFEHAGKGKVVIEVISDKKNGIMIEFIDKGKGIDDIDKAMEEGYSTGKGLGLGLPGSKRLVDDFHISSKIGEGTEIIIKKWLT